MSKELKSVLLIDDDPAANYIHRRVLQELDLFEEIIDVISGQDGLDYLLNSPTPDMIFLDINMPGMNGWEFIEKYDQLEEKYKSKVLVMMLTTSVNPDDRAHAKSISTITEFMNKPLTLEMAIDVINSHAHDLGIELIEK